MNLRTVGSECIYWCFYPKYRLRSVDEHKRLSLIHIFFVYGAGYTASIEETAELPAEVTATFVSQYAGDHSLFNDETAESLSLIHI